MTIEPETEEALKALQARIHWVEDRLEGAKHVIAMLFNAHAEATGSSPKILAARFRAGLDAVATSGAPFLPATQRAFEAADRFLHQLENIDEVPGGDPDRSLLPRKK